MPRNFRGIFIKIKHELHRLAQIKLVKKICENL